MSAASDATQRLGSGTGTVTSAHMGQVKNTELQSAAPKGVQTIAPGRSLAERFPDLAAEWDAEGNGTLLPEDVAYGSGKTVSWVCPNGHAPYVTKVNYRTSASKGCPVCARLRRSGPKKGKSLAEAFPDIAAEWDYEANYPLTPDTVAPRSNKKAHFVCPRGHGSHESFISNRTAENNCPLCCAEDRGPEQRKRNLPVKAVAVTSPELVADWNIELNTLIPQEVIGASRITNRYHSGTGCVCGKTASPREISATDLPLLCPEMFRI